MLALKALLVRLDLREQTANKARSDLLDLKGRKALKGRKDRLGQKANKGQPAQKGHKAL